MWCPHWQRCWFRYSCAPLLRCLFRLDSTASVRHGRQRCVAYGVLAVLLLQGTDSSAVLPMLCWHYCFCKALTPVLCCLCCVGSTAFARLGLQLVAFGELAALRPRVIGPGPPQPLGTSVSTRALHDKIPRSFGCAMSRRQLAGLPAGATRRGSALQPRM